MLKERIREDLNSARRDRDKARTVLLTTILSDVRNQEIQVGHEIGDEEVIGVITRAIKQRRESSEQMRAGNRPELAEKEDAEAGLLGGYLPPPVDETTVRELVREAIAGGASNIGAVMHHIMPAIKGRFDGKEANRIVREELGG